MRKDEIYRTRQAESGDFEFNRNVVEVFPDMLARSVPGYGLMIGVIGQLAVRFVRPNSHVYDLGCSLGAATFEILPHLREGCMLHAVDNSEAMIEELKATIARQDATKFDRIVLHFADIHSLEFQNASFIVSNLTLQFLPADQRAEVLRACYQALLPGGGMLVSEKVHFGDPAEQALLNTLHHDFKRSNGYSDLEISQKRQALENKLIPETKEVHLNRLRNAGFESVTLWFQCFNFASFLAIKSGP